MYLIYLKGGVSERERNLHLLMAGLALLGLLGRTWAFSDFFPCSHWQGAGSVVWQVVQELALEWNSSFPGKRFTHCAIVLAPDNMRVLWKLSVCAVDSKARVFIMNLIFI